MGLQIIAAPRRDADLLAVAALYEKLCPWLDRLRAEQLFRREAERVLLVHRRNVVEPIEVPDRLQIGLIFDQFFGSAMEQTDVWIDTLDHLSIKFQHKPKHAVGRRMLGAKIDGEIAEASFWHGESRLLRRQSAAARA
jgi:hypothetical protein